MYGTTEYLIGDVLDKLAELPDRSVQCVVTSPPYWSLRDYGTAAWEGGDAGCDHRKPATGTDPAKGSTLGGGKKTTGHSQESWGDTCHKCGATRIDQQLGLEAIHDCDLRRFVRLRNDLTDDERTIVMARLQGLGLL